MMAAAVKVLVVLAARKWEWAVAPSRVLAKYSPWGVITATESPPGTPLANLAHWLLTVSVKAGLDVACSVESPPHPVSSPAHTRPAARKGMEKESAFLEEVMCARCLTV